MRSRQALAPFPSAKAEGKDAFIDGQTAWIGAILAILWVLLALAVIVSLFGIVNTLVLSTFERTRELGTLRALGMNRRQVRRMVRHESVITALIGAILGIAAGLGLAAALVAWLGKYGITFAVPVPSLVTVAIIAAIAGMIAAALPARRARRIDVLERHSLTSKGRGLGGVERGAHRAQQVVAVEGLRQERGRRVIRSGDRGVAGVAGDEDDGEAGAALARGDGQLDAGHPGHHDVGDEHVGGVEPLQGDRAALDRDDLVAGGVQDPAGQHAHGVGVLDDQHGLAATARRARVTGLRRWRGGRRGA